MKKSRYNEEQMVKVLHEADQSEIAEVAQKHSVSDVTIYASLQLRFQLLRIAKRCWRVGTSSWGKCFGQLELVDVMRLRQLEQENAKLKKLEVAAKSGERVCASPTSRVRVPTRRVAATRVRADVSDQIDVAILAQADRRGTRRWQRRCVSCAVSALRYCRIFPRSTGTCDERRSISTRHRAAIATREHTRGSTLSQVRQRTRVRL